MCNTVQQYVYIVESCVLTVNLIFRHITLAVEWVQRS